MNAELGDVTRSNGAPSARNLLVTVFGDALLPHGPTTAASPRSLAALLASFEVNERLVRTSLTRLVNDGLLLVESVGRRSFYRVAPEALALFERADGRIYGPLHPDWDGSWTIVVIDAAEGSTASRSALRQELAWAGLGTVAPNVMASPVVAAADAAAVVDRLGGFTNVLVTRSQVVEGAGTVSADELAHRAVELGEVAGRYGGFVERFEPFADVDPAEPELAFKLRTLMVASYRRIVLTDPLLPAELLPADWIGNRARVVAAEVYDRCADAAEGFLAGTVELPDGRLTPGRRVGRFAVGR